MKKKTNGKDPAVLLYTQDFIVGTITMTHEQRGKYILLLCLQHQKGKLTLNDLTKVLSDDDIEIAEKFPLHADGFYYNDRMEMEIQNRKIRTDSSRNNGSKGGRPKTSILPNGEPNNNPQVNDGLTKIEPKNNPTGNETGNENEIETDNVNEYEDNKLYSYQFCYNTYTTILDELTPDEEWLEAVECADSTISWKYFYHKLNLSDNKKEELKQVVLSRHNYLQNKHLNKN